MIDLHIVSSLLSSSVIGQQQDLSDTIETEQDYIMMIRGKSGSLLKLSCYLGYATAGVRDPETIQIMDELAETIGIISQIRNDARDVKRWDKKNDLIQRKKTLPVLFMLADEEEMFAPLRNYYEGKISQAEFLLHKTACLDYIEQSGCLEYSSIIETLFKNRADQLLELLDADAEWKKAFRKLTLGS
jgi:competence protein ComQ